MHALRQRDWNWAMNIEHFRRTYCRPVGVLFVLAGIVAAKVWIFDYLKQLRGLHEISCSYRGERFFIPVMALGLGLLMSTFGYPGIRTLATTERKLNEVGWAIVIMIVAVMIAAEFWFRAQLESFGYTTIKRL
jgi:hypothetical protein